MRAMREILTLSGQFLFLVSIFPNAFILPYPAVPMTRGDLRLVDGMDDCKGSEDKFVRSDKWGFSCSLYLEFVTRLL